MSDVEVNKQLFHRAESMIRVNGILSIVFGAIGTFFAIIILAVLIADPSASSGYGTDDYAVGAGVMAFFVFFFWLVPHLFFLLAGTLLLRSPTPGAARGLIITNLVIGVMWNLVILIFSIIALTQTGDYERGYKKHA